MGAQGDKVGAQGDDGGVAEVTSCELDIAELPKISSKSLWKVWLLILLAFNFTGF